MERITTLYRSVSEVEYIQLMETGGFQVDPRSLGGKFFAEHPEHAVRWGYLLDGPGNYRIVRVELPTNVADTLMRWERLDGIGPARYGELHQLSDVMIRPFE